MSKKQIFVVVVYLLIFGGFGFTVGYSVGTEQQINNQCDYDVNNDGVVNSLDLLVLQKYILDN